MTDLSQKTDKQLRAILKKLGGKTTGRLSRDTLLARIEAFSPNALSIAETKIEEKLVVGVASQVLNETPLVKHLQQSQSDKTNSILSAIMPTPPKPAPKIGGCSVEQVLEAVESNINNGMQASFIENSWTFKKGKRQDSGSLSQPIYNIKRCADLVCQADYSAMFVK